MNYLLLAADAFQHTYYTAPVVCTRYYILMCVAVRIILVVPVVVCYKYAYFGTVNTCMYVYPVLLLLLLLLLLPLFAVLHLPPEVFSYKQQYIPSTFFYFEVHPLAVGSLVGGLGSPIIPLMAITGMHGAADGRQPAAVKPPLHFLSSNLIFHIIAYYVCSGVRASAARHGRPRHPRPRAGLPTSRHRQHEGGVLRLLGPELLARATRLGHLPHVQAPQRFRGVCV